MRILVVSLLTWMGLAWVLSAENFTLLTHAAIRMVASTPGVASFAHLMLQFLRLLSHVFSYFLHLPLIPAVIIPTQVTFSSALISTLPAHIGLKIIIKLYILLTLFSPHVMILIGTCSPCRLSCSCLLLVDAGLLVFGGSWVWKIVGSCVVSVSDAPRATFLLGQFLAL